MCIQADRSLREATLIAEELALSVGRSFSGSVDCRWAANLWAAAAGPRVVTGQSAGNGNGDASSCEGGSAPAADGQGTPCQQVSPFAERAPTKSGSSPCSAAGNALAALLLPAEPDSVATAAVAIASDRDDLFGDSLSSPIAATTVSRTDCGGLDVRQLAVLTAELQCGNVQTPFTNLAIEVAANIVVSMCHNRQALGEASSRVAASVDISCSSPGSSQSVLLDN